MKRKPITLSEGLEEFARKKVKRCNHKPEDVEYIGELDIANGWATQSLYWCSECGAHRKHGKRWRKPKGVPWK
uniref:Uncharacterized protein n=1 Tax=viral metagenome TaxID=1070528 RepID=A0A6H1ZGR8_9ZZZZ